MEQVRRFYRDHRVWSWVIVVFVGLFLIGAVIPSEESGSNKNREASEQENDQQAGEESRKKLAGCCWREPRTQEPAAPKPAAPKIHWRHSTPIGSPSAGRLADGVRLPAHGASFFTWDPVQRRSPDRAWRRWGTDRLVRVVLKVARGYRAAHPQAARMAVGDLSRPHGGDFGPRFGYIGHASHQNGLDVDVYYPRADGRELAPRNASQIDRALSQELVDRFLAAGAVMIFVGPNTRLTGPPGTVMALANHDNHLHVRID